MNRLIRALIGNEEHLAKRNMRWNMIGSFCYAFASIVLSFLVMRIVGEDQGGIFSFGFSTLGQQMFIIAYFGIRPFQVTDGDREYSFGDFYRHRLITCGAAVAAGLGYLLVCAGSGTYTMEKGWILFLLVLYKVTDGFADVYESEFQRNGHLHLTGKSNAFRTGLSVSCFLLTLWFTRNLGVSCVVAVAAQLAGVALFDAPVLRFVDGVDYGRGTEKSARLFRSTALLFLSAFLDFFIFSASKYAIDRNMGNAYSGYFNIIFMPTSVINLAAGFVIRPFLNSLTDFWNHERYPDFRREMWRIGLVITGLTLLAAVGALVLGRPVLGLLEALLGAGYEGKLTRYGASFVVIVLGGGFYAVLNLMYYALVIMRKQPAIFGVYLAAALAAYGLSTVMVRALGIWGASLAYLAVMVFMAGCFTALTVTAYRKRKNADE